MINDPLLQQMKKIKLTNNKYTLVDDEDYKYLSQFKWIYRRGYATRFVYFKNSNKGYALHREVIKVKKNQMLDHINRNTLDNRKNNLRICNKAQNAMNCKIHKHNTSGYKGVSWFRTSKKWRAYIVISNKQKHLGLFKTKKDAAIAYNTSAKKLFGEFANLNVIK